MNHAELVAEIRGRAAGRGLSSWPTPPSTPAMEAGWVDLVIFGRAPGPRSVRVLFVEVKSEDGRRTMPQVRMSWVIIAAGLKYRLYRPSDLANGVVDADLDWMAA